jgi:hypothetical protein
MWRMNDEEQGRGNTAILEGTRVEFPRLRESDLTLVNKSGIPRRQIPQMIGDVLKTIG